MSAGATTLSNASADAWRPAVNPWIIAITVTLATFMEVLDTSIANVALPHIAGSLSAGQDESTWVLTSYLVSNAIVLPLSGWLSSIVGRKNFYMGCVAFSPSALSCADWPRTWRFSSFAACCKALAEAVCNPASKPSSPIPSLPRSAAWPSPSTASP
jgi:MFS family permease